MYTYIPTCIYTTGIYLRLRERKNTFGCCFHLSYPPRQQLVCFVYKMVSCLLENAPLSFPGCFFALFKILPFCSLALSKTLPCSLRSFTFKLVLHCPVQNTPLLYSDNAPLPWLKYSLDLVLRNAPLPSPNLCLALCIIFSCSAYCFLPSPEYSLALCIMLHCPPRCSHALCIMLFCPPKYSLALHYTALLSPK